MEKNSTLPSKTPLAQAWHERVPTYEEERRFYHLIDLHGITQAWLKELLPHQAESDTRLYRMERISRPELAQNLWLLEKLKLDQLPPRLSEVVEGSTVEEFLTELEETIWLVQLSTLENAMEHSKDREGLLNVLDRVTWSYAKSLAEKRWPHFSETAPMKCFKAFEASPLTSKKGFLLESYNASSCSFYWLDSPHARESLARSPLLANLNSLLFEFIRGYFYGLSRSVRVEIAPTPLQELKTARITVTVT